MPQKNANRDFLARALTIVALVVGSLALFLPDSVLAPIFGNSTCVDGTDGTNGTDGTDGTDGVDGTDGTDGVDGVDGTDGTNGTNGTDGVDGKDGVCTPGDAGLIGPQGIQGIQGEIGLTGPQGLQGPQGIQGPQGEIGLTGAPGRDGVNGLGDYAWFYDKTEQTNSASNAVNIMRFDTVGVSHGVTMVSNSRITFANAGVYNIAFSAQIDKTDSGQDNVTIWLSKNGQDEPWSATKIDANNNNAKVVAAWNFFVEAQAGDYYELKWSSLDTNLRLYAQQANGSPAIPSIILTVNQVG